ncbi:MAG: FecR domain-containing protein [Bacteroidota bacterium]
MTKKEFQHLLEKYESGLCSPEEKQLLEQFLVSFQQPANKDNWSEQKEQETGERIYKRIKGRLSETNPSTVPSSKKNRLWWVLIALLLGLSAYWITQQLHKSKAPQEEKSSVVYASLVTKEKEQKELTLSDGTIIILNENSTLKYPPTFLPNEKRRVELSGEAFFKVTKDSLRPFIAVSENIETVVLGTSFNIDARPNAETIEIALVEGKVQVATANKKKLEILLPNEQFIYFKKEQRANKSSFRGNLAYAWKEDIILFEKARVREVIGVLSEKYNIVFQIEEEESIESLLVYRVNTKAYRLSQILEHITKVTDYQFTKNTDGSITVRPK